MDLMFYVPNRAGKINNLVKKLQIADSNGYWLRNTITLDKLRKSTLYRDELVLSLEEEKEHLLAYLNKCVKDRVKNFKIPKEVRLGGWFSELLYKPSSIFVDGAELKVVEHPFTFDYGENHDAGEDGDFHYEKDNCSVDVR